MQKNGEKKQCHGGIGLQTKILNKDVKAAVDFNCFSFRYLFPRHKLGAVLNLRIVQEANSTYDFPPS